MTQESDSSLITTAPRLKFNLRPIQKSLHCCFVDEQRSLIFRAGNKTALPYQYYFIRKSSMLGRIFLSEFYEKNERTVESIQTLTW